MIYPTSENKLNQSRRRGVFHGFTSSICPEARGTVWAQKKKSGQGVTKHNISHLRLIKRYIRAETLLMCMVYLAHVADLGASRLVRIIYGVLLGLDLHHTDPAHHNKTAPCDPDDL